MCADRHDIEVASAGVHAVRGQPPSLYAVQVCAVEGIDISHLRSQPLTATLVDRATHIFAMTGAHLETIHLLFPHGAEKSYLLREFEESGTTVWRDVPDPIGLGRDVYEVCAGTIKNALPSVLSFVEQSEFARPGGRRAGGAVHIHHGRRTPLQSRALIDLRRKSFTATPYDGLIRKFSMSLARKKNGNAKTSS